MPKYTPSPDEEELYGSVKPPGAGATADTPQAPPADNPTEPSPEPESDTETTDEETAESENTAIVPNKVLIGADGKPPKEGDEIVVQVVKVYGDEAEVRYAPAKPSGSGYGAESTDSEIEAMDTEKGM